MGRDMFASEKNHQDFHLARLDHAMHVGFGHWPRCFYEETSGFLTRKIHLFPHKSTPASDQTKHALAIALAAIQFGL
jgi:hypothetical protein